MQTACHDRFKIRLVSRDTAKTAETTLGRNVIRSRRYLDIWSLGQAYQNVALIRLPDSI